MKNDSFVSFVETKSKNVNYVEKAIQKALNPKRTQQKVNNSINTIDLFIKTLYQINGFVSPHMISAMRYKIKYHLYNDPIYDRNDIVDKKIKDELNAYLKFKIEVFNNKNYGVN